MADRMNRISRLFPNAFRPLPFMKKEMAHKIFHVVLIKSSH
jgi:hypothetical protein